MARRKEQMSDQSFLSFRSTHSGMTEEREAHVREQNARHLWDTSNAASQVSLTAPSLKTDVLPE